MGPLYAKLHDRDGEVELDDLTELGLGEARFQLGRLAEEVNEKLDSLADKD